MYNLTSFDIYKSVKTSIKITSISITLKSFLMPLCNTTFPCFLTFQSPSNHWLHFTAFYINGIIPMQIFALFNLFSIVILWSIYGRAYVNILFLFYYWIHFQYTDVPYILNPFISWWIYKLFPGLSYYKESCSEHDIYLLFLLGKY